MIFLKPIILGICNRIYTTRTLALKTKNKIEPPDEDWPWGIPINPLQ